MSIKGGNMVMPKRFRIVVCVLTMSLSTLNLQRAFAADSSRADFVVALDGNDTNPGTPDAPFATIARVRTAAREVIAKGLTRDLRIQIRGGTYLLDEPLVFNLEDSGTEQHAVIYEAWSHETPIISGGRALAGWQPAASGRWTVTLPEVADGTWWFRQLIADGKRCQRARHPNPGTPMTLTTVSPDVRDFTLSADIPAPDLAGRRAELVVQHHWAISRDEIESSTANTVRTTSPVGATGHSHLAAEPGKPAFLEHAIEFIDQPTEWYLDRATGVLTYLPPAGIDPNNQTIIAPRLRHLLIAGGERNNPIRNLVFRGLVFEHTNWTLPDIGYDGVQAGHYSPWWGGPTSILPLAVELSYAAGCRFDACVIRHTAATAFGFGPGCTQNAITGCHITDSGGNGIMVGYRADRNTDLLLNGNYILNQDWIDPADVPEANTVANNAVTRCGAIAWGAVGIWEAFSRNSHIHHNLVWNTPYTGISVGFNWGDNLTSHRDALVEYNHVHHVMQILNDGGAVYTLGPQPGAVLRGNLLHDVLPGTWPNIGWENNGFFFDAGSNQWTIDANIIYNTPPLGTWPGQGFDTLIRFNPARNDQMNFVDAAPENPAGTNILGVQPGDPTYPTAQAAMAGLQPSAPTFTISASSTAPEVVIRGQAEPWTRIASATFDDLDVTDGIKVSPNGAITGTFLPKGKLHFASAALTLTTNLPDATPGVTAHSNPLDIWVPDADRDGDLDLDDFGRFQACLTGTARPQTDPACATALLDDNTWVDAADLTLLIPCLSGPEVAIDPDCVR